MAIQYKGGVNFDVIPQIRGAVSQIETIFARYGYILEITSAKDSTHSTGSLHYIGAAVDFRSKGLPSNVKQSIFQELRRSFPLPTWWIDLEYLGGMNEHYHLEYKPAKRAEIDFFEDSDLVTTYLPGQQDDLNIFFPSMPGIEQPYPRYPEGTIPPEYFTPYELPVDWKILVGAALAIYLLIELTD